MIEIRNFRKVYGRFIAVHDLSLKIERGDIFGFIGPNGAGKTTTIRFLATLLKSSGGDAFVNGYSVTRHPADVKRQIGFMPDSFGVYDGMRVWEFLDFFGAAFGIAAAKRSKIIEDVLALLDLSVKRDDPVEALSRGMRQRLCLAKTLVHNPPILILDEPASGLDPRARIEMVELLKELRRMGKTILISSHILSELKDLCTSIGIIERGRLIAQGRILDLLRKIRRTPHYEARFPGGDDKARVLLGRHPKIGNVREEDGSFRFDFDGTPQEAAELNASLVREGAPPAHFREVEVNLEEAFLRFTKGEVA